MRIALAQLNVVVGDLDGNVERIAAAIAEAKRAGADLVVLPELAVTGLPARGPPAAARVRPRGARGGRRGRARLRRDRRARRRAGVRPRPRERRLRLRGRRRAGRLPQAVPARTTASSTSTATSPPAASSCCSGSATSLVGPTICEDVWQPGPPATDLALAGATLLVNLSASPYHVGKAEDREEMLVTRARDNAAYVAFCNLVGGQDELVFDGHSVVLDDEGEVVARAPGLRGGAARRRPRPDRGDRPPAARRAPPRARALARRARPLRRRSSCRRRASVAEPVARNRRRRSPRSSSRCGSRSGSACATTSRRTASATS